MSFTLTMSNVIVGRSELDLVAVDPNGPSLVVIEVRWRSRRDYGLAEETVDRLKLDRLRRAAFRLLESGHFADGTPVPKLSLRFDLVVVEPSGPLRHHRHVPA